MKFTIEIHYDGDQLTAMQKRDLEKLTIANKSTIGSAVGTALATVLNSTLSYSPSMPTVTNTEVTLDPQTSTRRGQNPISSRDY